MRMKRRLSFFLLFPWKAWEGKLIDGGKWERLFVLRLFKTLLLLILICQIPSCATYSPESAFSSVNPPHGMCPRHHVALIEIAGYGPSPDNKDEINYVPGFLEFYEREWRHLPCIEPLDFSTTPNAMDQSPTKVWYCPVCQARYESAYRQFEEKYSKQVAARQN